MEINESKIVEISELTGIPTWKLKEALGVPLPVCNAETVEEAEMFYNDATTDGDYRRACFLRWDELSLKAAEKAKTLDELNDVHNASPDDGKAIKHILMRYLELVETFSDAKNVLYMTPDDSEEEKAALVKMYELF